MTTEFEQPDGELIERLQRLSTPNIADTNHESVQVISDPITPLHSACEFVGAARTVRLYPNALWIPLRTLENTCEGEVVVIDTDDCISEAIWGELLSTYADRKGSVGMVTNGAVRDIAAIRDLSYPIFARAHVPRGPSGTEEDAMNVTVTIGEATIDPGDVLVGDEDGIVVLRRGAVNEIIEAAENVDEKEREVKQRIKQGEDLDRILESVGMA